MAYKSKNDVVREYIENEIVPILKFKDLDFKKVISLVKLKTGAREDIIMFTINNLIENSIIKEEHILTIPDNQVSDWLKELKEDEDKSKKEAEDVLKDHLPEKETQEIKEKS